MLSTLSSVYLGPARVIGVADRKAKLRLHDQEFWADVALAFPYELSVEDVVLTINQDTHWYVIGVLQGTGKTTLTVPGDLALKAPQGSIELEAGKQVSIQGPLVRLNAGRLEIFAKSAWEKFTKVTRWVKEACKVHAGRFLTRTDGEYRLRAGTIKEKAVGDVRIDGTKINLG